MKYFRGYRHINSIDIRLLSPLLLYQGNRYCNEKVEKEDIAANKSRCYQGNETWWTRSRNGTAWPWLPFA